MPSPHSFFYLFACLSDLFPLSRTWYGPATGYRNPVSQHPHPRPSCTPISSAELATDENQVALSDWMAEARRDQWHRLGHLSWPGHAGAWRQLCISALQPPWASNMTRAQELCYLYSWRLEASRTSYTVGDRTSFTYTQQSYFTKSSSAPLPFTLCLRNMECGLQTGAVMGCSWPEIMGCSCTCQSAGCSWIQ